MSKNMTRKGLAVSAGLALVGSVLTGVPASANPTSLQVTPLLGTTYETVLGATFNLKLLAPGNTGQVVDFYVEGATAATLTVKEGTAATSWTSVPTINTAVTSNVVDNTAKTSNFAVTSSAAKYVPVSIALTSAVTATTSIKITPFLDNILGDDKPGNGELTGTPITVTFHKASEVTPTISKLTLAPLGSGSTTVALVTFNKNVNAADTVGALAKVEFKENGGGAQNGTGNAYDVADAAYKSSTTAITVNGGDVVSAQAFMVGETTGGPAVLATATAGEVASLANQAVDPGNYFLATAGATSNAVRAGAGSLSIYTSVTAETNKLASNQPVTFTVSEASANNLNGSLTSGGKTLSNASTGSTLEKIEVEVRSDSLGYATLSLSYTGLKAGDTFKVKATANGVDAAESDEITYTVVTPAETTLVPTVVYGGTDDNSDNTETPVVAVARGASASVAYTLVDNFGLPAEGNFRVNWEVAAGTNAVALTGTSTFSGGAATVTWTDNSTTNEIRNLTLDLEKQNSTTLAWADSTTETSEPTVHVRSISAVQTPNRITLTNGVAASATASAITALYVSGDKRLGAGTKDWNTVATHTLSGVVYGTDGLAVSGATVTISAPGVLFRTTVDEVYAADSITVRANAGGGFRVYYASNKSGKVSFTVTSGSASATESTTFAGAAETAGKTISFEGTPDNAARGTTLIVKIKIADSFGNGVPAGTTSATKLNISWSGPGFVGTIPTKAGADGTAQFSVLLGANDSGSGVVTVGYDQNGDGDLLDTADRSASKTITIGAAAVVTPSQGTSVKRTGNTVVVRVTGYAKSRIVLNGVRVASRSTLGTLSRTLTLRAGRNVIQIVVDGTVIRTVRYTR